MADERVMPYTGLAGAIQAFGQPVAQAIGGRIMDESAVKRIADLMKAEQGALSSAETELKQQINSLIEASNMETMQVPEVGAGGRITMKEVEVPEEVRNKMKEQAQPQLVSALSRMAEVRRKKDFLETNPVTGALIRGDVKRSKDLQALGLIQYPKVEPVKKTLQKFELGGEDILMRVDEYGNYEQIASAEKPTEWKFQSQRNIGGMDYMLFTNPRGETKVIRAAETVDKTGGGAGEQLSVAKFQKDFNEEAWKYGFSVARATLPQGITEDDLNAIYAIAKGEGGKKKDREERVAEILKQRIDIDDYEAEAIAREYVDTVTREKDNYIRNAQEDWAGTPFGELIKPAKTAPKVNRFTGKMLTGTD